MIVSHPLLAVDELINCVTDFPRLWSHYGACIQSICKWYYNLVSITNPKRDKESREEHWVTSALHSAAVVDFFMGWSA